MTLRELMIIYNTQEKMEYIMFEFLKKFSRKDKIDSYNITKIQRLFQELLSFEKNNRKEIIYVERYKDDIGDTIQYYYDVYFREETSKESYALDFMDWKEVIDFNIDEKSLWKYGEETVLIEILWEITFDGFDYETVKKRSEELMRRICETKEGE